MWLNFHDNILWSLTLVKTKEKKILTENLTEKLQKLKSKFTLIQD